MKKRYLFYSPLLIVLLLVSRIAASDALKARETMLYYVDLVRSGNTESAEGIWEPATLKRANRLPIDYENVKLKVDYDSPLIKYFNRLKPYLDNCITSNVPLEEGVIRWRFQAEDNGVKFIHYYYTLEKNGFHWLITAADYYTRDWPMIESKYFRLYHNPEMENWINEIAVDALDAFVDKLAVELSITPERMVILAEKKIDYYLCRGDLEVEKLSGKRTRSVYDQAADAVISSIIADYNAVTRLMINFSMGRPVPAGVSFLREGLASLYGGRWQRAAGVVLDFGKYILNFDLVEMDSVLVYDIEIDSMNMADIMTRVAACLADYIESIIGRDSLFALYGKLSGDPDNVSQLRAEGIKTAISETCGLSWEDFIKGFDSFINSEIVFRGDILPGTVQAGQVLLEDRSGLKISRSGNWLNIEYKPTSLDSSDIIVLFDKEESLDGKSSVLFTEQHARSIDYAGYRWGIRLDRNEIGLYDYATNEIKAKYINTLDASTEYLDIDVQRIRAHFDIGLIGDENIRFTEYEIIR